MLKAQVGSPQSVVGSAVGAASSRDIAAGYKAVILRPKAGRLVGQMSRLSKS